MTTTSQVIESIEFGELTVDAGGRRVLRGGQRVAMGPQEFKLLKTLIDNRGRVLTGDELRILVWSDDPSKNAVPAGDVNALYVSIRKLRAALGDHGKYILNIPKVGYTIAEEALSEMTESGSIVSLEPESPFIGRAAEIAKIRDAMARSRIVTLTGPPGIGKSRLATEAIKDMGGEAISIDLGSVEDGKFVGNALLSALGIAEQPGRDAKSEIINAMKERRVLLFLDNCEHVIEDAASVVNAILRSCRGVKVISASREAMRLPGEAVFPVGPLDVPTDDSADANKYDAVKLFVQLAKQRLPGFELTRRDAKAVAELCRQLEGIPVAIELAAVQVDAYTVDQILALMSDRLRLLQRRGGDISRHQTLESAIDWSYELLSDPEKVLLQRLSVFAGGWTSETARLVCSGDGLDSDEIVHLLAGLVRRSLIQLGVRKGTHRYRMLEMVRQFARKRLRDSGSEEPMRRRHTAEYLKLAETAHDAGEKDDWPALLEAEYSNIRAVLRRTVTVKEDISAGLWLCGYLVRFWFIHGHINEAQTWTNEALAKDDGSDRAARAKALVSAGFFFGQMPGSKEDAARGRACFEESLQIWNELGDERNAGITQLSYSFLLNRLGEYDAAIEAAEFGLKIFRPTDDYSNTARAANNLALTQMDIGDFGSARPIFETALAAARAAGDLYLEAVCLHNLGDHSVLTDNLDEADRFLAESLELFSGLEHRPLVARTELLQGEVLARRGEIEDSIRIQKAALAEFGEIGDNQGIASALETIGSTMARIEGREVTAVELISAAASLRKRIDIALGPARMKLIDEVLDVCRENLGETAYSQALETGSTISTTQAVTNALAV